MMPRVTEEKSVGYAVVNPPNNTRALGRGIVVSKLLANPSTRYVIDWDAIYLEKNRQMDLKNPFHTYEREARLIKL